jgi:hypothetical protein
MYAEDSKLYDGIKDVSGELHFSLFVAVSNEHIYDINNEQANPGYRTKVGSPVQCQSRLSLRFFLSK